MYKVIADNISESPPPASNDYYWNDTSVYDPMTIGILASSDSMYYRFGQDKKTLSRLRNNGNWLLQNSDINNNGILGYGLPIDYDMFQDGSVTPKNTETAITTAFAIKGLLDWVEADEDAPRTEIVLKIGRMIKPYSRPDKSVLIPYTLGLNDDYQVANSSAMLLGEMQHFVNYAVLDERTKLQEDIDSQMKIIKKHMIVQKHYAYWKYSLETNKQNDLVHAAYIIEGISNYEKYGGRVFEADELALIKAHLFNFYNKPLNSWHDKPVSKRTVANPDAKLWGIGMAIAVISQFYQEKDLAEITIDECLDKYKISKGKYSHSTELRNYYIRENAHLALGISAFLNYASN